MKKHDLAYVMGEYPIERELKFGVRCKGCDGALSTVVRVNQSDEGLTTRHMDTMAIFMRKQFIEENGDDCDLADAFRAARRVHAA